MLNIICYSRCATCRRARDFLDKREIEYDERDIRTENPTIEELRQWRKLTDLPVKSMFNITGASYREMSLKGKLDTMPEDEALALLATDGMLIKRPILVSDDFVLFGFKESEWVSKLC